MYKDKSSKTLLYVLIAFLLCGVFYYAYKDINGQTRNGLSEESAVAIKEAIEKAALQCYVIEGAYPVDLNYLKDNYGLTINEKAYYVVYNAYAENQLPDIRIVRK